MLLLIEERRLRAIAASGVSFWRYESKSPLDSVEADFHAHYGIRTQAPTFPCGRSTVISFPLRRKVALVAFSEKVTRASVEPSANFAAETTKPASHAIGSTVTGETIGDFLAAS